jgi:hypothetical protein
MKAYLTRGGSKWGEPNMLKQSSTRRSNGTIFIQKGKRVTTSLNTILQTRKKNQCRCTKPSEIRRWLPNICMKIAKYDIPILLFIKGLDKCYLVHTP